MLYLLSIFFLLQGEPSSAKGFMYPSPSPDGTKIAFSLYGDIWIVDTSGGRALRITDSQGFEGFPIWSPNGKFIAFASDRDGNDDIFLIPSDGSAPPKRLTYHSSWDKPLFFSDDGQYIYFTSRRTEFRGAVYRISIKGGNPEKVIDFRIRDAVTIPGTDTIIFSRGWTPWWRRKYRGSANWDIWLMDMGDGILKRLTEFEGRDGWPMYSSYNKKIYFVSNDNEEAINTLFVMNLDGSNREMLIKVREDIHYPSISRNGRVIAFEMGGDLFIYNIVKGNWRRIDVTVGADYKEGENFMKKYTKNATEFSLSPKGNELAFVVFGDIYVMKLRKGKPEKIVRLTYTPEPEKDISWHPEEEKIIFSSLKEGDWDIYTITPETEKTFTDDITFKVEKIIDFPETEKRPIYSPDGKKIAFLKNQGTLYIADSDGSNIKRLYPGNDILWFSWSPDSRWIAFSRTELAWREDVFIVSVEGGEAFNLTDHPNDDYRPIWSRDGRKLFFASRNPEGDLWVKYVFLREEDEKKGLEFWKEMADSVPPLKKVEIEFEGIRDRMHEVAHWRGEYFFWTLSPDGKKVAIKAKDRDNIEIWVSDWLGDEVKKITTGNQNPKYFQFSSDAKRVYFLDKNGMLKYVDIDTNKIKNLPFKIEAELEKPVYYRTLFLEAWWLLKDGFYDPHFHGIDWRKMYEKYVDLASSRRNRREFRNVVRLMLGELNASHLGIWDETGEERKYTGILGIEYDPAYSGEGIKIKRVINKTPAQKEGLKPGDIILEINGKRIRKGSNFYSYLRKKSGERVKLTIKRGGKILKISLKTISPYELSDILYENWVEANRKIVEEKSDDRIGYLHIRAMNTESLKKFYEDVYKNRDKEGLIIDIRYNGGGYTHDEILNFLSREVYGFYIERGETVKTYSPSFFWGKPVVLLINENSYSDAEIFPMGFKKLKIGKVVGKTTYGAVIGTTNLKLMDGITTFRVPRTGWYRLNGISLENNPVKPDIYVEDLPFFDNKPGGKQLETAIKILLEELKK